MRIETVPEVILAEVKRHISTELTKRGFHAPITVTTESTRSNNVFIGLQSEPFQTTPVFLASLTLANFGGSVKTSEDDPDLVKIWLPISVRYDHFSGGSNGCELFTFLASYAIDKVRAPSFAADANNLFDISIR